EFVESGRSRRSLAVEDEDARKRSADPESPALVRVKAQDITRLHIILRARPDERAASFIDALDAAIEDGDVSRALKLCDGAHALVCVRQSFDARETQRRRRIPSRRFLASVKSGARADEHAPVSIFGNHIDGSLRQLLNRFPQRGRAVINEESAI